MGETFKKKIHKSLGKADVETKKMRLVDATLDLDAIKAEKAEANQDANKRLKDTRGEIRTLANAIKAGQLEVEVECEERLNDKKKIMEVVNVETGEVVDTRPLTAEERQAGLFDRPEHANGAGKPKAAKRGRKGKDAEAEA